MNNFTSIKIKISFDGWRQLSRRNQSAILQSARSKFKNANFIDHNGLLIESENEEDTCRFCLYVCEAFKEHFQNLNGYTIKRISKKILFNLEDKKRKLPFNLFKRLVFESEFEEMKLILAGNLYLKPIDIEYFFSTFEDENIILKEIEEDFLTDIYRSLVLFASEKIRKFS